MCIDFFDLKTKSQKLTAVLDGTINTSGTIHSATGGTDTARLQPKGKKHISTGAVIPKSSFPDPRTRRSLGDFCDRTHSVKQKPGRCRRISTPSLQLPRSITVSSN